MSAALALHVNSTAYNLMDAEQRDAVCDWLRAIGHEPDETRGVRVIGEGVVDVEHFIDQRADIWECTYTTVFSPILPPFISSWEIEHEPFRPTDGDPT